MATVFLSYSREDKPIARRIVAALEKNGVTVWWDDLLQGGERFAETTESELGEAEVVVVIWSKTSIRSHWVHDEASRGRDRNRLVPVSIDGSAPPLGFGQFQALDMSKWKGRGAAPEMAVLLRAIDIAIGAPQPSRRSLPAGTNLARRRLLVGCACAIALSGSAAVAWKSGMFSAPPADTSIAVLPFRNLSGDAGQDYFAEGIAEEIRNTLSRNPMLRVIATTSSRMFRTGEQSVNDLAERLGIGTVLDGSVRRSDQLVRIAVQMIDASSGQTRWSQTFDGPLGDIFAIQGKITTAVLQMLNIQMSGVGVVASGSASGGTSNPAAFDAFLKGRAAFERFDQSGFIEGAKHFRTAYSLDPQYAAAFSGEARCLNNASYAIKQLAEAADFKQKALELARHGNRIAPGSPFSMTVLGATLREHLEFREAQPLLEQAYMRAPRFLDVPVLYGLHQGYLGKFNDAFQALDQALSIDPLNPRILLAKLWVTYWSGQAAEARKLTDRIWTEYPVFGRPDDRHYFGFVCELALVQLGQARVSAEALRDPYERDWALALAALSAGDRAPAERWFGTWPVENFGGPDIGWSRLQLAAHALPEREALRLLENEYRLRNGNLVRALVDPILAPIRTRPEFHKVLREIGLVD